MSKKITSFISIIGLGVIVGLTVFFISQQVFGAISVQNEINMNNRRIIGLPVPTTTNEVARKAYVDSLSGVSGDFTVGREANVKYLTMRVMPLVGGSGHVCFTSRDGDGRTPWRIGTCGSLAEYKLNVKNLGLGLDTIMQLTPREYDWTKEMNGRHDLGLVAEEVEAVNPLLAAYDGDNGELSGVKYSHMVALLIKGIQEQQGEIEELKQEIGGLKAIINK